MVNNKNLFRESVVFGNFVNADDIKVGGNQANAKFKRNVLIGNDLTLGLENSTTTNGVTTYTNTGGNLLVKRNGITYTLTPTILSHLSTISDNIQDQINDITTPDLSSYAPKANPSFTGTAIAPTPDNTDDSTKIATTEWVNNQGYLTTSPDLTIYAPKNNPEFTGIPKAPTPATTDDSTKIATTEWVNNVLETSILTYIEIYGLSSGGISLIKGNYKYHIFKSNGNFILNQNRTAEILLIAGGGAGGNNHGGGGGAGGFISVKNQNLILSTTYSIVVGAGGTSSVTAGNSSFIGGVISLSVIGGGRGGGAISSPGTDGGSGGGGTGYNSAARFGNLSTKTSGLGNKGGNGSFASSSNFGAGGGGGGAGGEGLSGQSNAPNEAVTGGQGGEGTNTEFQQILDIAVKMPSSWITATTGGVIASGGSGGSWGNSVVNARIGGGGAGGTDNGASGYIPPIAGEDFTGGGGGGGGSGGQSGANGGNGLVIIRFLHGII